MSELRLLLPALALAVGSASSVCAERAIEKSVVYVECTAGGKTSRGSGVVVSAQGHVLTAKHVVAGGTGPIPDDVQCKGSIEAADSNVAQKLVVQPTALPVDAALLRFTNPPDDAEPVLYCDVADWMIRKHIFVSGFPGNTGTGAASYREGVLATTIPNEDGMLETDGQTVAGMSGGPVFSSNLAGLIGMVAGAEFTADGSVSFYGILPVSSIAQALNLQKSEEPCYHETREVDFLDDQGSWIASWQAGDEAVSLNVGIDEGFCFLQGVHGEFNHPDDQVWVVEKDGVYELNGQNFGGGHHGAWARCVWYD